MTRHFEDGRFDEAAADWRWGYIVVVLTAVAAVAAAAVVAAVAADAAAMKELPLVPAPDCLFLRENRAK